METIVTRYIPMMDVILDGSIPFNLSGLLQVMSQSLTKATKTKLTICDTLLLEVSHFSVMRKVRLSGRTPERVLRAFAFLFGAFLLYGIRKKQAEKTERGKSRQAIANLSSDGLE